MSVPAPPGDDAAPCLSAANREAADGALKIVTEAIAANDLDRAARMLGKAERLTGGADHDGLEAARKAVALLTTIERALRCGRTPTLAHPEIKYDPYGVLGVTSVASAGEIKKAFHKLSLTVHPDKCAHAGATDAFACVAGAFNTLRDPASRASHDLAAKRAANPAAAHAWARPAASGQPRPPPPPPPPPRPPQPAGPPTRETLLHATLNAGPATFTKMLCRAVMASRTGVKSNLAIRVVDVMWARAGGDAARATLLLQELIVQTRVRLEADPTGGSVDAAAVAARQEDRKREAAAREAFAAQERAARQAAAHQAAMQAANEKARLVREEAEKAREAATAAREAARVEVAFSEAMQAGVAAAMAPLRAGAHLDMANEHRFREVARMVALKKTEDSLKQGGLYDAAVATLGLNELQRLIFGMVDRAVTAHIASRASASATNAAAPPAAAAPKPAPSAATPPPAPSAPPPPPPAAAAPPPPPAAAAAAAAGGGTPTVAAGSAKRPVPARQETQEGKRKRARTAEGARDAAKGLKQVGIGSFFRKPEAKAEATAEATAEAEAAASASAAAAAAASASASASAAAAQPAAKKARVASRRSAVPAGVEVVDLEEEEEVGAAAVEAPAAAAVAGGGVHEME